jgi:molybdate transport system regulatory protein
VKPAIHFHIRHHARTTDSTIGLGTIVLLEAIGTTGSITAAAKSVGISYRKAWLLVDETNRSLVRAAVKTAAGGKRGGGTQLTPTGAVLCRRYREIECQLDIAVSLELGALLGSMPPRTIE